MPEAARVLSGPGEIACTRIPLGPSLGGHVARGRLQRGFHWPHHIVVLYDHLGAVVGHREQRAAILHQRLGELGHAHERPAGQLHGLQKTFLGAVDHASLQVLLRCEGDRVQAQVEAAPFLGDGVEHGLELALLGQVERQQQRGVDFACQRLDIGSRPVIEVGDRDIGPERPEGLGTAPGNRLVVGYARDQRLLSLEQGQR